MRRFFFLLPLLGASTTLFVLSSIPGLTPPDLGITWSDKVYHAVAFVVYGVCVSIASVGWNAELSWHQVARRVMIVGVLFAMSDEYHQSFVPNRTSSWSDVAADGVGLLLSTFAITPLRTLLFRWGFLKRFN